MPVPWAAIQPTAKGGYNWAALDEIVALAARHGLRVLPFLYGTPRWIARKPTTLPIDSAKARTAWTAFLTRPSRRYGPGGEFWTEHAPGVVKYEPAIPAAADPHLADLERGQLLLLRLPGLAAALREAGDRSPARRSKRSTPAPR